VFQTKRLDCGSIPVLGSSKNRGESYPIIQIKEFFSSGPPFVNYKKYSKLKKILNFFLLNCNLNEFLHISGDIDSKNKVHHIWEMPRLWLFLDY